MQGVFYPERGAWIVLVIATSPIWGFGTYCLITGFWLEALGSLGFAALIVGYNSTIRLVVDGEKIVFKRYFFVAWSIEASDAKLRRGRVGDLKMQSGYKVESHGRQVGFLLDGWFAKEAMEQLLRLTNSA